MKLEYTQTTSIEVDEQELWEAVMGSAFEEHPWYTDVRYLDGASWDKVGSVRVSMWDDEEGEEDDSITKSKTITIMDMYKALLTLVSQGQKHCGCPMIRTEDEDGDPASDPFVDADACFGDLIMQQIMYGEIVFG